MERFNGIPMKYSVYGVQSASISHLNQKRLLFKIDNVFKIPLCVGRGVGGGWVWVEQDLLQKSITKCSLCIGQPRYPVVLILLVYNNIFQ